MDKFKIFSGNKREREICEFTSPLGARFSTEFLDIVNRNIRHHVVCRANQSGYTIFSGEPNEGGIPLADFTRSNGFYARANDCTLKIAANVDIAICVIMSIAIDIHCRNQEEFLI